MATRLYFGDGSVPIISPTADASWEKTTDVNRRPLEPSKGNAPDSAFESLVTAGFTNNSPAGAADVLLLQLISAPINGNTTISGAIKGQIRVLESAAAADLRMQCVIRVLDGAGTTVRGTLIASNAGALASEFSTSLTNRKIPLGGSTVPTSVNALDGDRIVVELGARKHENAANSRTFTMRSGNPSGTDLAEDETSTTDNVPWIEFADTITFKAGAVRFTDEPARVATNPTDAALRVTDLPVRVATLPTDAALRVTDLPVRVATRVSRGPSTSRGYIVG